MTVFTEQLIRQIMRSAVSSMELSNIFISPEEEERLVQQQIEKHKDPNYVPSLTRRWRGEEHSDADIVPDGA